MEIPGVYEESVAQQTNVDGKRFPLILHAQENHFSSIDQLCEWIRSNEGILQKKLLEFGAIFLRGFPCSTAQEFTDVIKSFSFPNFEYIGGNAVRTQITDRVYTANESPSSEPIPFHHELAQSPDYPLHLFFYCDKSPETGGETSLLPSWTVYEYLEAEFPEFLQAIKTKGIRYIRVMSEEDDPSSAIGRGWKSTYWTDSREHVETHLASKGYSWEWMENGNLKTISPVLPGIRESSRADGSNVFFNQMIAAYTGWTDARNDPKKAIVLGDFTPVDIHAMEGIIAIMSRLSTNIPWMDGDILLVDNILCMHARVPYTGPRRILASLTH